MRIATSNQALDPLLDKMPCDGVYVMSRAITLKDDCGDEYTVFTHHTHSSYDEIYYAFFNDLNAAIVKFASEESLRAGRNIEPEVIPRLTPHKMRHTFATYLRKSGADLDEIRELLGHKSIATTQIYDTVDIEDMKTTVSKLSY